MIMEKIRYDKVKKEVLERTEEILNTRRLVKTHIEIDISTDEIPAMEWTCKVFVNGECE